MNSSVPRTDLSPRVQAVLDDLVDVMLAEGFAHLRLDELAARLHCSKATLYQLAPSKQQLVVRVVRRFFSRATGRVEDRIAGAPDALTAVQAYLRAVADELRPATPAFYADVAAFAPAAALYRRNTEAAAGRVRELIAGGVEDGTLRAVRPEFVGIAAATLMAAIQRGELRAATGIDDATAYAELADLVTAAVSRPTGFGRPAVSQMATNRYQSATRPD